MPDRIEVIKLSAKDTRQFWEIPVLFEDDHLLALNKPADLLTAPDRADPGRPSLMKLLHAAIASGKPWASRRQLSYLMNAHRLDSETTGVLLLAKSRPVLTRLADTLGSEKPHRTYVALVHGAPTQEEFEIKAPLARHSAKPGLLRVDLQGGKRARTIVRKQETFSGYSLLRCQPLNERPHQIRVHLKHHRLPVCGDTRYGGHHLFLSQLKPDYRFKDKQPERPLIQRPALHAEELGLTHPSSGEWISIQAPWPKDLTVAVKYLRRFAAQQGSGA